LTDRCHFILVQLLIGSAEGLGDGFGIAQPVEFFLQLFLFVFLELGGFQFVQLEADEVQFFAAF
jgi:hypothetical protein